MLKINFKLLKIYFRNTKKIISKYYKNYFKIIGNNKKIVRPRNRSISPFSPETVIT